MGHSFNEPERFSYLSLLKRKILVTMSNGLTLDGVVSRVFESHIQLNDEGKTLLNINYIMCLENHGIPPESNGLNIYNPARENKCL